MKLELVDRFNTTSCLDVVHRCQPKTIISDNGTNFVGAAREFKKCFAKLQRDEITVKLSESGVKFQSTSSASHWWSLERLVQSCKKALFNVLGKRSLNEDRLRTVLCILEQLLNNRTLTEVSSDVFDLHPLTPNHFLIGQVNVNWPNALFSGKAVSYRKHFRDQHSILVAVWNRWMIEYLPTLRQRNKWAKEEIEEIKKGDLVWRQKFFERTRKRKSQNSADILKYLDTKLTLIILNSFF